MMDILSVYASLSEFAIKKRQGNIRLNVLASVFKNLKSSLSHLYLFDSTFQEMSNYPMFDKLFLRASSRVEAVASAKKIRPPAETRACSERVTPA